ncbi:unnamed protein product [Brassica rapa subsp. trilocularis]
MIINLLLWYTNRKERSLKELCITRMMLRSNLFQKLTRPIRWRFAKSYVLLKQ